MSIVLVVDDSKTQRHMIARLLRENQFEVFTASDGLQALAKAGVVMPDVVILDIVMPHMNGFEVCRKLRDSHRQARILMCSSQSSSVDRYWATRNGASGYIAKPYESIELIDAVKALAESGSVN